MIKCFEANYPESLGVVLVHRSPWIFQGQRPPYLHWRIANNFQGIWKIIRGWLDPVVAAKVHFTNTIEDLEEYIPRSQILKELGGDEDWTYEYVEPRSSENSRMADETTKNRLFEEREELVNKFEEATVKLISHPNDVDAAALKVERDILAAKLRDNYWSYDPYIRSRSWYDRIGVIKEGGKLDFYPKKQNGTAAEIPMPPFIQPSPDDVD